MRRLRVVPDGFCEEERRGHVGGALASGKRRVERVEHRGQRLARQQTAIDLQHALVWDRVDGRAARDDAEVCRGFAQRRVFVLFDGCGVFLDGLDDGGGLVNRVIAEPGKSGMGTGSLVSRRGNGRRPCARGALAAASVRR